MGTDASALAELERYRDDVRETDALMELAGKLAARMDKMKPFTAADAAIAGTVEEHADAIAGLVENATENRGRLSAFVERIRALDDPGERETLLRYYIGGAGGWDEVADAMGYSPRQVFRFRSRGIKHLDAQREEVEDMETMKDTANDIRLQLLELADRCDAMGARIGEGSMAGQAALNAAANLHDAAAALGTRIRHEGTGGIIRRG